MLYLDKDNKIKFDDKHFWKNEAEFWNNYGKIYVHLEAATPYKDILHDIGDILSNGEYKHWLDAGCGPGTMIDQIIKYQKSFESIIGIDFDGVMTDQATRRLKHYKNIFIKNADLSRPLLFQNEYFDGIIANLVLSYIIIFDNKYVGKDALEMSLREIYRLLKYDGLFIWTTPIENVNFNKVFLASWRQVFNPFTPQYIYYGPKILSYALKIQQKGKQGIYHFFTENDLNNIMSNIGFRNIKIKKTFADQAYLISAIK